jgi:hypothetical protein
MISSRRALSFVVPTLLVVQGCASQPVAAPMPPSPPQASSESAPEPAPSTLPAGGTPAAPEPQANQVGQGPPQPKGDVRATFFTSPSELRDELAVHQIAHRLYAGVELEGAASYDSQAGATNYDAYLDSITGALRWVPFYGLTGSFEGSYDLQGSNGYSTDEAILTLGAVATEPWYITVGQTNLPFGEFNSHFREDPTTQVLGEIQGREIAAGYETDTLELTFAVRQGQSGSQSFSWVGNLTFSPVKDMDAGVYWTSDLTKSFEVHQLIHDAQAANPGSPISYSPVAGAGTFMSLQKNRYSVDFELIAAVDKFAAGLLSASAQRPWAWNFEATVRPRNPWEVGVRLEQSSGLPDSPQLQYGMETTYSFGPHAALSLEYLRGNFANGAGNRNLVTAGMLLRW